MTALMLQTALLMLVTYFAGCFIGCFVRRTFFAHTLEEDAGELLPALEGLRRQRPGLRVVLWGKNLTNKAYLQSVLESQLADASSYGEPRTFGGEVSVKF